MSTVRDSLSEHYRQHHHDREPPLLLFASLLVTLYRMRHYLTSECMSAELGWLELASASIHHCITALFTGLVPVCFSDTAIPHRGYRTYTGPLAGVCLVADSTWEG